jgi:hypothetical protein
MGQLVYHLDGFSVIVDAVLVEVPTHLAEAFSDTRRHRGFDPRPVALELIDDQ